MLSVLEVTQRVPPTCVIKIDFTYRASPHFFQFSFVLLHQPPFLLQHRPQLGDGLPRGLLQPVCFPGKEPSSGRFGARGNPPVAGGVGGVVGGVGGGVVGV